MLQYFDVHMHDPAVRYKRRIGYTGQSNKQMISNSNEEMPGQSGQ